MLDLKNISLVIHNGRGDPLGGKILGWLCSQMQFGEVFHLSPVRPDGPGYWIQMPSKLDYADANILSSKLLGEIGSKPWYMNIETDGFPVHPELWDPSFLEWDYIGAPWPDTCHFVKYGRVGNGGCSIRSRRFIEATRAARPIRDGENADVYLCCCPEVRALAESAGCKYAPVEVALRFSFELPLSDFPDWTHAQSFAFHKTLPNYQQLLN